MMRNQYKCYYTKGNDCVYIDLLFDGEIEGIENVTATLGKIKYNIMQR